METALDSELAEMLRIALDNREDRQSFHMILDWMMDHSWEDRRQIEAMEFLHTHGFSLEMSNEPLARSDGNNVWMRQEPRVYLQIKSPQILTVYCFEMDEYFSLEFLSKIRNSIHIFDPDRYIFDPDRYKRKVK